MRGTGTVKTQLIKTKINLRNSNIFSKGCLYYSYRSNADITLYQNQSECVQNVLFIKLTEHAKVQIRLFDILLQNYDGG